MVERKRGERERREREREKRGRKEGIKKKKKRGWVVESDNHRLL